MAKSVPSKESKLSQIQVLRRLRLDFAAFRKSKEYQQDRIPYALRHAALAAMDKGISIAKVKSACGVTSSQLEKWEENRCIPLKDLTSEASKDVRILNVREDPDENIGKREKVKVELQVGHCRVSIQWG